MSSDQIFAVTQKMFNTLTEHLRKCDDEKCFCQELVKELGSKYE